MSRPDVRTALFPSLADLCAHADLTSASCLADLRRLPKLATLIELSLLNEHIQACLRRPDLGMPLSRFIEPTLLRRLLEWHTNSDCVVPFSPRAIREAIRLVLSLPHDLNTAALSRKDRFVIGRVLFALAPNPKPATTEATPLSVTVSKVDAIRLGAYLPRTSRPDFYGYIDKSFARIPADAADARLASDSQLSELQYQCGLIAWSQVVSNTRSPLTDGVRAVNTLLLAGAMGLDKSQLTAILNNIAVDFARPEPLSDASSGGISLLMKRPWCLLPDRTLLLLDADFAIDSLTYGHWAKTRKLMPPERQSWFKGTLLQDSARELIHDALRVSSNPCWQELVTKHEVDAAFRSRNEVLLVEVKSVGAFPFDHSIADQNDIIALLRKRLIASPRTTRSNRMRDGGLTQILKRCRKIIASPELFGLERPPTMIYPILVVDDEWACVKSIGAALQKELAPELMPRALSKLSRTRVLEPFLLHVADLLEFVRLGSELDVFQLCFRWDVTGRPDLSLGHWLRSLELESDASRQSFFSRVIHELRGSMLEPPTKRCRCGGLAECTLAIVDPEWRCQSCKALSPAILEDEPEVAAYVSNLLERVQEAG